MSAPRPAVDVFTAGGVELAVHAEPPGRVALVVRLGAAAVLRVELPAGRARRLATAFGRAVRLAENKHS